MIVVDRSEMASTRGSCRGCCSRPWASSGSACPASAPTIRRAGRPAAATAPAGRPARARADRQGPRRDLRAILRQAVDDKVVPGISLLLAHRGEVIFKEAYGNLKVDQKVQMASSSKSVTATLLMILVDRGKLALDDPVEKYLPEFKGITLNGKPPARPPTVRNLLSNMSGLPGDILTESIIRRLRERAAQARAEAGGKAAPTPMPTSPMPSRRAART